MPDTEVVIDNLGFPEDPRWHDGALWFSDMDAKAVFRSDTPGKVTKVLSVEGIPSGLGWLPNGNLLVVSMSDCRLLQLEASCTREVADLSALTSFRCNDMVVDDEGRAYIGTFGFDFEAMEPFAPGQVILVPPRGSPRVVADGLAFPNGMAITPDKKTLIVSETLGERLTAFEIAPDGSLGNQRAWAHLPGLTPDGISLDSKGAVWVASPVSSAVFRIQEGGKILAKISVANQAYACRLGGPEGQTLYIATSYPLPSLFTLQGLPAPFMQAKNRLIGRIEAVAVGVPAAGFP